ncbi:NTP transferase domain-containing protein [Candidatus Micrarchaeota archaeon]|nr:NTP transferase domain-containing protein [Candidatus Micrarchaeota archaeon]
MASVPLERVTVTIESGLLKAVDATVEKGGAKSRSHAFDTLLRRALSSIQLRKALILAGGSAQELSGPGGREIKPLVEVGGIPVIERLLLQLKRYGIEEAVIIVGFGGERIVSRLQNGEQLGIKISYVWEDAQSGLGSAGCLKLAQARFSEPFLLSYSDVLYDGLDLCDLNQFHRANGGLATLVLANAEKARSFGVAKMSGSRVTDFSEKPASAESHLVNAGVCACDPAIFSFIPKKAPTSLERDLLPSIAHKGKLVGYVYGGAWFDVGKERGLQEAQRHFEGK